MCFQSCDGRCPDLIHDSSRCAFSGRPSHTTRTWKSGSSKFTDSFHTCRYSKVGNLLGSELPIPRAGVKALMCWTGTTPDPTMREVQRQPLFWVKTQRLSPPTTLYHLWAPCWCWDGNNYSKVILEQPRHCGWCQTPTVLAAATVRWQNKRLGVGLLGAARWLLHLCTPGVSPGGSPTRSVLLCPLLFCNNSVLGV